MLDTKKNAIPLSNYFNHACFVVEMRQQRIAPQKYVKSTHRVPVAYPFYVLSPANDARLQSAWRRFRGRE